MLQWREENNIRLTDCRYASKVSDVIGNLNMGLMILADGRLRGMSPRGMISEKRTEEYQDILYFDDGEKNWCYLHVSIGDDGSVVRTLYVRENNGSFKTDGRDVSKEEAYEFQNLVKDIATVAGEYPNQAFTALRENGSLMFCGLNAVEIAGFDDQKKTFSMCPTASLLPFQGQIRALVSSGLFLNSEDRLVSLSGLAANAGQVELDGLHPETFKNWREIQSACLSVYGDLFAVTSDGKVLVDINENAGCQDMGQYDVEGWKNVHCITSGGYNMESCAYTLGVTGEGKVLIAGVLPGENTYSQKNAEKTDSVVEIGMKRPGDAVKLPENDVKPPENDVKLPGIEALTLNGETVWSVNLADCDLMLGTDRRAPKSLTVEQRRESGRSDGYYFEKPIENVLAMFIPMSITASETSGSSETAWAIFVNAGLPGEASGTWYQAGDFEYVNGEKSIAYALFDQPATLFGFSAGPLSDQGPKIIKIGYFTSEAVLLFQELEDAISFLNSIVN